MASKIGRPKNDKGLPMTCKRCGYPWRYGGEGYYATCPKCHTPNRVPGREIVKINED